jgi:hypothetical protein
MLDLLESVREVANLPNFGDYDDTRSWLSAVISAAWAIPSNSPGGVLDDDTVQFISQLAGSIELFEPIYRLILYRLPSNRTLTPEEALLAVRPIAEQAKASGVNPLAVLRVIEALADLVRFIREQ